MRCEALLAVLAACSLVDARRVYHAHHKNHKRYYHGPSGWKDGHPPGPSYPLPSASPASSDPQTTIAPAQITSAQPTWSTLIETTFTTSERSVLPSGAPVTAGTPSMSIGLYSGSSAVPVGYSSSSAVSGLLTAYIGSSKASAYPSGYRSNATSVYPSVFVTGTASALPSSYSSNATATSTNSTVPATASPTNATSVDFSGIRGVNVGGWLVLEQWMDSDVFDGTTATDQYSFDQTDGAADKLQTHWDTYFTESDVQQIAAWGLNALRIPIGYWAYNNTGTPYITGADAYMEKAIGWARQYGLKVLVDCHGSPGSQNGFDNSGHAGNVQWQSDDNLQLSISVLETMAEKYGSSSYADVVFGLELVNEPISWGANSFTTTQTWAQEAYAAVKAKATNPNLIVVMHDGFEGPSDWMTVSRTINVVEGVSDVKSVAKFAVDTHLYQNQEAADSTLTQAQHVAKACNWTTSDLLAPSAGLPVYVGEFSAQTNICANPDNTTVAGSTCYEDGCQCSTNVALEDWDTPLKSATREFFEAQVEAFEYAAQGWFLWSWKAPGSWGLQNLIENGVVGSSVSDRAFPDLCSFSNSSSSY